MRSFVIGFALVLASTAFVVNRSGYEDAPPNDQPSPLSSDGGDQQSYNSDGKQNDRLEAEIGEPVPSAEARTLFSVSRTLIELGRTAEKKVKKSKP